MSDRPPRHAIVLAGGDDVPGSLADDLPTGALVVAADGGLHLAAPLGLRVDLVVGDLDSVDPGLLKRAAAAGTRVERHPVAKDATDLALALDAAVSAGAIHLTVVGGAGGRVDHELATWGLLAAPDYAEVEVELRSARGRTSVLRGGRSLTLAGPPGQLVSLVPIHGTARAVTTTGLRYPLAAEDLPAGSTRGVSNEIVADRATVELGDGVLLTIVPSPSRTSEPA